MKTNPDKAFNKDRYEGAIPSTLCMGCGHDQISKHIIRAFHESQTDPFSIAKISGIGCSSKTPNYFLKQARGLNSIHGRMASVATGVKIANRDLKVIGVSGDGDTGSIGLASFLHTVRKNVPMIYLVENNGVYGLTKGQFSATAEKDSRLKKKKIQAFYTMDLCLMALSAGASFVARSFSGDTKQLTEILKLALNYEGFAFIDVISPCVAYGNEQDFPHSFSAMKKGKLPLHDLDILEEKEALEQDFKEGELGKIALPGGKFLQLKKLGDKDHDPRDRNKAFQLLQDSSKNSETVTGLLYYKEEKGFFENMELSQKALTSFKENEIRLKPKELKEILRHYK